MPKTGKHYCVYLVGIYGYITVYANDEAQAIEIAQRFADEIDPPENRPTSRYTANTETHVEEACDADIREAYALWRGRR